MFWSFEQMARGRPSDGSSSARQGTLLALPFGYSLISTGAIVALGVWLFGGDQDVPWIQIVAGLAAGALIYGVSAALGSP